MLVHLSGTVIHHDDFNHTVIFQQLPPVNISSATFSVRQVMLHCETGVFPVNYYMISSNMADRCSTNPRQEIFAFATRRASSIILHEPPTPYVYKSQLRDLRDAVFKIHSVAPHTRVNNKITSEISTIKITLEIVEC